MVSVDRRILSADDVAQLLGLLKTRRDLGDESFRAWLEQAISGKDSLEHHILPIRSLTIQLPTDPSLRWSTMTGELESMHHATYRLVRYMTETSDSLLPDLRSLTVLAGETAPYCGKTFRVTLADTAAGRAGQNCLTGTLDSTEAAVHIRKHLEQSGARTMHWHITKEILQQDETHITHCVQALPLPARLQHLEISMPPLPFIPAELRTDDQLDKEAKGKNKRQWMLERIIARLQQMHGRPKILEVNGLCPSFREQPQASLGGVDDGMGRRMALDLSRATDEQRSAPKLLCNVQDKARSLLKAWLGERTIGEPTPMTSMSDAIHRFAGPHSTPSPAGTPTAVYVNIHSYQSAGRCAGCGLAYASVMPFSPYAVIGDRPASLKTGYMTVYRVMRDVSRETLPVGDLA